MKIKIISPRNHSCQQRSSSPVHIAVCLYLSRWCRNTKISAMELLPLAIWFQEFLSPAGFFIYRQVHPIAYPEDFSFGLGTNCLAALYMDGGLFFIILGMFVFGIVLRKFEVCIFSGTASSFFVFCMAFYFLTRVVYIPRSSLLSPFKYALWMYLIMSLISYLSAKRRRSS